MIFPKGEIVHQNLSTSYTDIPQLLSTLKAQGFAGTMEIEFPDSKGILFMHGGEIINAEMGAEGNSKIVAGQEAIQKVLALAGQKNGTINIYRLSPEQVEFVVGTLKSELVLKGLSTDFVRLDRLIQKLKEDKHYGFVETYTKENQPMGTIFFKDGELAEMYVASESGPSFFFDQKAIPAFLDNVVKQGAIVNVYKSTDKTTPQPRREAATARREEERVLKVEERAPREPAKVAREEKKAKEESPPKEAETMKELISVLQEMFFKVERFVDGVSEKGTFLRALKKTFVEKWDTYPFLDPFAGQFEYYEGKMTLAGGISPENFARGIGECFHITLANIKKEFIKNMTPPLGLRADMESSFRRYQEIAKELGVETKSMSLFMV